MDIRHCRLIVFLVAGVLASPAHSGLGNVTSVAFELSDGDSIRIKAVAACALEVRMRYRSKSFRRTIESESLCGAVIDDTKVYFDGASIQLEPFRASRGLAARVPLHSVVEVLDAEDRPVGAVANLIVTIIVSEGVAPGCKVVASISPIHEGTIGEGLERSFDCTTRGGRWVMQRRPPVPE